MYHINLLSRPQAVPSLATTHAEKQSTILTFTNALAVVTNLITALGSWYNLFALISPLKSAPMRIGGEG